MAVTKPEEQTSRRNKQEKAKTKQKQKTGQSEGMVSWQCQ
jgi:hypothetical protein